MPAHVQDGAGADRREHMGSDQVAVRGVIGTSDNVSKKVGLISGVDFFVTEVRRGVFVCHFICHYKSGLNGFDERKGN